MQLTIEIDEDNITELIEKELTRRILADRDYIGRESKYGVRQGVDKAVKQYIYKEKDAIIERVVERASREMVKKGLPKFLEKMTN
mgnify:CR=1 FL=1